MPVERSARTIVLEFRGESSKSELFNGTHGGERASFRKSTGWQ
jgi:hypothetical protein